MPTADKQINFNVSATALATVAAGLSSGQWGTLVTNGMTQGLITRGDSDSILSYCRRGHWDSINKRIYFYGHTHASLNLGRMIRYEDISNTWVVDQDGPPGADGNPEHGYYHFAMRPSDSQLFYRNYNGATIQTRTVGGTSWSNAGSIPGSAFVDWNVANAIDWHPGLNSGAGGLVFCGGGMIATSNSSGGWWTIRQQGSIAGDYHNFSTYNQVDGNVYCGGGNSSTNMWRVASNGTCTQVASTPFVIGADSAAGQHTIFRGTGTGKMFAANNSGSIREYDTTNNTWSAQVSTLPFTASQGLYFGVPIDTYGVVLFVYITGGLTPSTTMHIWKH